jgi:hypothetical protein
MRHVRRYIVSHINLPSQNSCVCAESIAPLGFGLIDQAHPRLWIMSLRRVGVKKSMAQRLAGKGIEQFRHSGAEKFSRLAPTHVMEMYE